MGDSWTCARNIQDQLGTCCCITKWGSTQPTLKGQVKGTKDTIERASSSKARAYIQQNK